MSPKPNVSGERVPQILEAATNVFSRLGFSRARMEDVADEAGVSKGTLYLYFESKDAIIQSMMETMLRRELDRGRTIAQETGSASDKLTSFTQVIVADIKKMRPFIGLYFEFMALATRREETRTLIRSFFQEFMDILVPLLQEGVDNSEFRDIDTEAAAVAIGALFEGSILLWAYAPDAIDLDRHVSSAIRLLLDGLLA